MQDIIICIYYVNYEINSGHSTPAKPDNLNASYSHGETTSDLDLTDYGRPKANPKRQLSEINEGIAWYSKAVTSHNKLFRPPAAHHH